MPGWEVFTVGDDICWMQPGPGWPPVGDQSGVGLLRRRAGHQPEDEQERLRHDPQGHAVHQRRRSPRTTSPGGKASARATPVTDWQGRPYDPKNGPAAHPNSRFTVSAVHNPAYTDGSREPEGRADLGDRVRRPPPRARAAGLRSPQLAARRAGRRVGCLRDHRRRHRRRGRRAPRLDGDEAVLRLQLRATTSSTG